MSEKERNKKWPTDSENRHRWCDDCKGKYVGTRDCPSCGGTLTFIDEVVIQRPIKK